MPHRAGQTRRGSRKSSGAKPAPTSDKTLLRNDANAINAKDEAAAAPPSAPSGLASANTSAVARGTTSTTRADDDAPLARNNNGASATHVRGGEESKNNTNVTSSSSSIHDEGGSIVFVSYFLPGTHTETIDALGSRSKREDKKNVDMEEEGETKGETNRDKDAV